MEARTIIVKPVITEKSLQEAVNGKYTFLVARYATKNDVKEAIEKLFGVKVEKVYSNIVKGTKQRVTKKGRKTVDATYKKARVALKEGQKIALFEEVMQG